jgi:phage tail-like protein
VAVSFDRSFTGLGGAKDVSSLPLFRRIAFLGPDREIATLLDTSESYFRRKQPTRITLKRGITTSNQLQAWIESVAKGIVNRKNGVIILLDDERKPVVRWKFFNAFPRKWEGPVFDAKGTDVAIETLTLCCERLERD